MSIANELKPSLKELKRDTSTDGVPCQFTATDGDGTVHTIDCIRSTNHQGTTLSFAGEIATVGYSLRASSDDLDGYEVHTGDRLTDSTDDQEYRVLAVTWDPSLVQCRIDLESPDA